MQLNQVVSMFGADLQRRYGEKIHKITLHGGFSCPNRDGTLGRGGCTFVMSPLSLMKRNRLNRLVSKFVIKKPKSREPAAI